MAATPRLESSILGISLQEAILTLDQRLQAATEEYAVASAELAGAFIADADARLNLEYIEDDTRARAYRDGLPGTNEAQRAAFLAVRLADDPRVDAARRARDGAHAARVRAEHRFRVCDVSVKSLRARLDALGALVRGAP